jgi:Cytochrome P460
MRLLFFVIAFALTIFALRADAAEKITAEKAYLKYGAMNLRTPKPVEVDASIAELCVVGSGRALEDYGIHAGVPVNFYANDSAASVIRRDGKLYPVGSTIVKEKLSLGGKPLAVGGMIKRQSEYDLANGDWEYFYGESIKKFTSGRIESCVGCHAKAKQTDYVFLRKNR